MSEIHISANRDPDNPDRWLNINMEANGFEYKEDIISLLTGVIQNMGYAHKAPK